MNIDQAATKFHLLPAYITPKPQKAAFVIGMDIYEL